MAALLVLTFSTGIIDALSWLGLDGVFTANMTGNVLIIGMGAVGAGGAHWLPPLIALVIFLLGAAGVGRLQRHAAPGWGTRTTVIFTAVGVTVIVLGVITLIWPPHRFDASTFVVMGVLALAMGVQGAEAMRLAVPQLITVAVSSAVVGLGVSLFLGAGADAGGRRDLLRRTLAIAALAAGAVVGSLLRPVAFGVGLLVAGIVAVAVPGIRSLRARATAARDGGTRGQVR